MLYHLMEQGNRSQQTLSAVWNPNHALNYILP